MRTLIALLAVASLSGCVLNTVSQPPVAGLMAHVVHRVDTYLAASPLAPEQAELYKNQKDLLSSLLARNPDRVPARELLEVAGPIMTLHDALVRGDPALTPTQQLTYLRSTHLIRRAITEAEKPLVD